jgi:Outer membrane protein beta-barrel domain
MSITSRGSVVALVWVALCLGAGAACAQSAPMTYWTPGWPLGFGGNMATDQNFDTYGNFPSFDGSDAGGGFRYKFPNGFFVGSERSSLGLSGFNGATGNFGSFTAEGVQFGYNLQNSPVKFFGGVDTLKYNSGIGGNFSSPFDSTSSTAGYGAHAGIEFQPASNVSLSLGFGYTQQSGRLDTDTKSPSLSNTSQFDLVGGRR